MRIAPLLLTLLAGCASFGGDLERAKNSWQGARYDEVVSQWGAPTRSATLSDGQQAHTWVSEPGYSGASPTSVGVFGGSAGTGAGVGVVFGMPGMYGGEPQRCERTFVFRDDRVARQSWLGQQAFCAQFGKR